MICPRCDGAAKIDGVECRFCRGTGVRSQEPMLVFNITGDWYAILQEYMKAHPKQSLSSFYDYLKANYEPPKQKT